jgi:8-oxo-dGTP diphosphatase
MWEFPGGKVEPGESDIEALIRECDEELGVRIAVGDRVGDDVLLGHGRAVLRVYTARLLDGGQPQALEHAELRWLAANELNTVAWLPADAPIVAALHPLLAAQP